MNIDVKNSSIRTATKEDLPVLAQFLQILVEAERPFDPTLKDGEIFYYDIEELITDPATEIMVVEYDNKIIGSGYAQIRPGKPFEKHESFGYLGFMFVSSEFRGKGISGLLLKALQKWILSQGITEVRLQVYDENESAVKAYEKAGFKKLLTTMRYDIS